MFPSPPCFEPQGTAVHTAPEAPEGISYSMSLPRHLVERAVAAVHNERPEVNLLDMSLKSLWARCTSAPFVRKTILGLVLPQLFSSLFVFAHPMTTYPEISASFYRAICLSGVLSTPTSSCGRCLRGTPVPTRTRWRITPPCGVLRVNYTVIGVDGMAAYTLKTFRQIHTSRDSTPDNHWWPQGGKRGWCPSRPNRRDHSGSVPLSCPYDS